MPELADRVRPQLSDPPPNYASRHASYDLAKLRGKGLVERIDHTRRYRVRPRGVRILAGLLVLRERLIKPVLAGLGKPRLGRPPKRIDTVDPHSVNLQREMRCLFGTLGLAA